ncbi:MAG: hypothetical protein V4498_05280 [candidate division FCPU426 bacterium]
MKPATCPRCDAPLAGTEKACPQCGRPVAAGPALASVATKPKNCPICKLPLYNANISGNPMLHCAECKGVGMERDSMMKLQPYGAKEIELSAEERSYKRPQFFEPRKRPPFLICPFCSKRMNEAKLGPVATDLCEACDSLWLEGPRLKSFDEMVGPYKWRMVNKKKR